MCLCFLFPFFFVFFFKCESISSGTAQAFEGYNEAIKLKIIAGRQQSTGSFASVNGDHPCRMKTYVYIGSRSAKEQVGLRKTSLDHVHKTCLCVALSCSD